MSVSPSDVLVSVAAWGYVSALFTRDPFSALIVMVFWLFIVAPTYFPAADAIDAFFFIPGAVVIASIAALAMVKLLSIGQLVDVWMTGSGGGLGANREESNFPFMSLAFVFLFFTVFFSVAAATGAGFLAGTWIVNEAVAIILAIAFALATIAAVVFTGYSIKRGNRFGSSHDYASVYYFFIMLLVGIIPAVVWHLITSSGVSRGIWSSVTVLVLDLFFIGIGIWVFEYKDGGETRAQNRRFYINSSTSSRISVGGRVLLATLVHAFIFFVGGFGIDATTTVQEMFEYPYVAFYLGLMILIFGGLYLVIILCYLSRSDSPYAPLFGEDTDAVPPSSDSTSKRTSPPIANKTMQQSFSTQQQQQQQQQPTISSRLRSRKSPSDSEDWNYNV